MTTPHTDTDELDKALELYYGGCDDVKCASFTKHRSCQLRAYDMILSWANQHARKVERHYESLLAKTPRITLGPVKSGLGPYTCDSQHQDQLSQQDKKE